MLTTLLILNEIHLAENKKLPIENQDDYLS